jgi:hypothetical protein
MAVLGVAVFVLWEWQQKNMGRRWVLKRLAYLCASFLAAAVALNAYFILKAGLGHFLHSTIVFGVRYYSSEPDNSWGMYLAEFPRLSPWPGLPPLITNVFVHLLVPYVYFAFALYYRLRRDMFPGELWDRLMELEAVGLCLFLGVAPAAEGQRLATAALPATILLVWTLNSWRRTGPFFVMALAAGSLAFAIAFPARMQTRRWVYLDVSAGRVALSDTSRQEEFQWVVSHTRPGDYFFDNAGVHPFVVLARVRSPGSVLFLTLTDYTRPEQVENLINGLQIHRVRFILWEAGFEIPVETGIGGDHLEPLRKYLRAHYRVVKSFPGLDQVWERNEFAD